MPVLNRSDPRVLQDGAYSKHPRGDDWRLYRCLGLDEVGRAVFEDQHSLRMVFHPPQGPFAQALVFVAQGLPQTSSERAWSDEQAALLGS